MSRDDDTQSVIDSLKAEQRELVSEADSLRRFIACMRKLIDTAGSRHRDTEVYGLLEQVLDNALGAVNARDGSILVPDKRTRELVFVVVRGDEPNTELMGRRLPAGEGIAGWVAKNRRAVIVNNATTDERFYPGVDREIDYRTRSVLAAPLIGSGRIIGIVEVVNKRDRRLFSVGNQTLLNLMCRFAGELLASTMRDVDLSETGNLVYAQRNRAPHRRPEPT